MTLKSSVTPTSDQIKNARWLLRDSVGKPEDFIRKRLGSLLHSMGIDYELSYPPPLAAGPCDIYLPRRRTIMETKTTGLANYPDKPQSRNNAESPKQQLERYLHAEIDYELQSFDFDGESKRPWIGILTDGKLWHAWRYPHEHKAAGTPIRTAYIPSTPTALMQYLQEVLEGEPVGKQWIPTNPVKIFEPRLRSLEHIFENLPPSARQSTNTKRMLWLSMLRIASMEPENELSAMKLFVAHSFLVVLARGVIHLLAKPREQPNVDTVCGSGFVAWIVSTMRGRKWVEEFLTEIYSFEWRRRPGDVLKPLYEQFVGARDRQMFGEFYTPDWLAELIVSVICDDEWCDRAIESALISRRRNSQLTGIGVLDPTCGSGTFLYHAAKRLLMSGLAQHLTNSERATVVCSLVHGIDVHPVAAEISRATLLRALPAEPMYGEAALQIHEGDALQTYGDELENVFRPTDENIRILTPGDREVMIPRCLVDQPNFENDLRNLMTTATAQRNLPSYFLSGRKESEKILIRQCFEQLSAVIEHEGDSVWAWYMKNIIGPFRLSETKVDRIVANPPWVRMSKIQAPSRKRALEQFSMKEDIDLWPGGKQAPNFDIAQLFVKRARQLFLNNPSSDPAAWLVKKSCLKAGHWSKFRSWHSSILKQTLDLEAIRPFGGGDARKCCVLFEGRPSNLGAKKDGAKHLVATLTEGRTPKSHDNIHDILQRIEIRPAANPLPQSMSEYVDERGKPYFRKGATMIPRVLIVSERIINEEHDNKTHITMTRSMHEPWKEIEPQQGIVPKTWLRRLIISKAVLPFGTSSNECNHAIVPLSDNNLLIEHPEKTCAFWRVLDSIYQEHKGAGRNNPGNLLSRINYGSELSYQLHIPRSNEKKLVIYPSSGDIMRSCRVRPGEYIIDYTLFRFLARTEEEAAYIVALLNAPCLEEAFLQSRESGRDFELHPWRKIPIERFDHNKDTHLTLAGLAKTAEVKVEAWLDHQAKKVSNSRGQVALSMRIRNMLKTEGVLTEIDKIVRELLPSQAC